MWNKKAERERIILIPRVSQKKDWILTPIKQLSRILTVFSMGWCFRFCTTSIFIAFTMASKYQLTCDATQINGIVSLFVRFLAPRFFGSKGAPKKQTPIKIGT
jgi:hypothetical protein